MFTDEKCLTFAIRENDRFINISSDLERSYIHGPLLIPNIR